MGAARPGQAGVRPKGASGGAPPERHRPALSHLGCHHKGQWQESDIPVPRVLLGRGQGELCWNCQCTTGQN